LACIDFGEVMVFNETYEFIHTQDVPPSTWPEYLETPVSFGADERYFVQGTYGGTSTMACVDFQYDVTESGCCPCDNDSRGGQKGHLADWAGEFCPGRRLDGTWAWSTGDTCHGRGVDYVWGVAIR